MQRLVPALVASALLLAPLGARAADLVVWWEKGFYPQEDAAVREIIAAFEQETGKQVELVRHGRDLDQQTAAVQAAIDAGRPPDFLFGQVASIRSRAGRKRAGWSTSPTPSERSRICSTPTPSNSRRSGTAVTAAPPFTLCRWPATPRTSTSGRAC